MRIRSSTSLLVPVLIAGAAALAGAQPTAIDFTSDAKPLAPPPGRHFGEVTGIDIDARRHVFVFHRTGSHSSVHDGVASELWEFGPDGRFIREIGRDLYGFAFAHTVRVDRQGNIWTSDEGTNMIVKFSPAGEVLLTLGRRDEAVEPAAEHVPGAPPPAPRWGAFARPTDVAWDNDGNIFIADGYTNSRVVKADKDGRWIKTWGERGTGPGQFNILHTIANDAKGNIYVGDRTNRRIQVFDPEGTLLRIITIDVPFPKEPNVMVGAMPRAGANPLSVSGAPWGICITPGPTQYLYSVDAVPGRIYKLTLDGKVLGFLGEAGKQVGEFGWAHQLACPSENELWVGEILNWRVQKLTLRPTAAQR
ncbi:MAG: peptidyl-alpha-hydroxyglycine alpha-amidating lyase family protein [Gemmatimonadota bacterium]|nr:peptidyl-alpha-hydroxyglycine alpha-amidating lyase family protein [Gemmatimonadota bacterium]